MRRLLARLAARPLAYGVAGALCLAGVAAAAEPEAKPWYAKLTGSEAKPKAEPTFATPKAPPVSGPLDGNTLVAVIGAEQAAWDRRLEVCHKLRAVAATTNDDALAAKADALEQQATQLYHQRMARFGVKSGKPAEAAAVAAAPAAGTPPTFKVVK